MTEKNIDGDRFNRRLPLYGAVGALILFVPITIYGNDILEVLYILVMAPSITFILLILAIRKKGLRRLAVFSMLVAYSAVSWGLFTVSREMHWTTRWFLWSKNYKAKVLTEPDSTNGTLRHIEWDGWGFPGAGDTIVYLVFDPNDSLLTAARSHSSGKFGGIPCEVPRVRRLENQYYLVLFYTDTDWTHCN